MALRRYDGVTAFTGMPGSGKTYALAEIAYRAEKKGIPVWCNAGFDIAACVEQGRIFSSFEEFLYIPNGSIVVWDELPLYVNSRKWQEFPDGLLYRLTQVRKDGLKLYYSAIDEDMVDVTVRRLTFWFWHCRAITQRTLRRELWPPDKYRKAKTRAYAKEWVRVAPHIANTYNTLGKVAAPVRLDDDRDRPKWAKVNLELGPEAVRPALRSGDWDGAVSGAVVRSDAVAASDGQEKPSKKRDRSASGSAGARTAVGRRTPAGRRQAAPSSAPEPSSAPVVALDPDAPPAWGRVRPLS